MQFQRRDFVRYLGVFLTAAPFFSYFPAKAKDSVESAYNNFMGLSPEDSAQDEDFWAWVQQSYTVNPNIINLNNGGVSPQPKVVQDAFDNFNRMCNEGPSYYMWRILDQGREMLRKRLANLAGTSIEEVSICRNTTEALDMVIFGLNLSKGDEVVLTKQDYPNVINAWKQREKRDGIIIKWVNLNLPLENDDEIVNQFKNTFTSKTKAVNITHMINWSGQILPSRKIADEAHKLGIDVIVDAAHTFAHIDFRIDDLNCDFLGTSLHKWLCAPFGTGMLYVKKNKIKTIWPLYPNDKPESEDIRKFETLGTRSFPAEHAIGSAINFHNSITTKRKEERLRFLKNYWASKVVKLDRVKLQTSLKENYSCALAIFSIDGMKPADIESTLLSKYKIHTTPIDWENIKGVRVTPHVYTSTKDLDILVEAITEMSKS
ncbi:MAG: aminotransferase V [Ignavibacteria bacterium GWB2_35_12]|nr:MAG: aminotransferase V [Ignavibacteria bacterium GWA2_35_8]OGU39073.1 MAG: aminotransferase V [Ignavibacteria bacterium GWB2_35_12]OGU87920.1 MAG: aminotransferase V [Ignavibacteria bacterium RIFOXYA2_FULL_35_10]OGV21782.1 MAG: aminotransferase V [Ignavibacteria bacterium RIFOXYC2_FULL_35_21]